MAVRLFLVLVLCGTPALAAAAPAGSPTDAGGRVVAGSIAFSSAGGEYHADEAGDRTQEWSLQPGGGVFVADGLALNLLAAGTWFRQGGVVSNHYELGPTVEYYFDTVGGDDPRGHGIPYLGLGYLWGRVRSEQPGAATAWNSGSGLAAAGLAWMVTGTAAVDLGVQYRFGTYTQKEPVDGLRRHGDRWNVRWGLKVFLP